MSLITSQEYDAAIRRGDRAVAAGVATGTLHVVEALPPEWTDEERKQGWRQLSSGNVAAVQHQAIDAAQRAMPPVQP